jgi:hypothetical protein
VLLRGASRAYIPLRKAREVLCCTLVN